MMGRVLVLMGVAFILAGLLVSVLPRMPGIGRLPGDILIQRANVSFYFPVTTCLLLSVILTVVLWLGSRR